MPTFNEIYKQHLDVGLNIRLTNPQIITALRKYAFDNRDQNGVVLDKSAAVEEILYFFLLGDHK